MAGPDSHAEAGARQIRAVRLRSALRDSNRGNDPYSPDGRYLLFSRQFDLYISYRKADGGWTEPENLGAPINSPEIDICPMVTPDGKYLFFLSRRGGESHVWWVSTGFIKK